MALIVGSITVLSGISTWPNSILTSVGSEEQGKSLRLEAAKPAPVPEDQAIKAVLDAQVAAWNQGDIDGFMAGYWKDEKLTFVSGGDITRGWEPTRERYVKKYQADGKDKMGKLTFSELKIEPLDPTAAIVLGRFELVRGEKTDWGRFTLAFKKFPEGWRIIHDHTSVPVIEKK
jgi:beta-aspartyl-peptidase (threonine type)